MKIMKIISQNYLNIVNFYIKIKFNLLFLNVYKHTRKNYKPNKSKNLKSNKFLQVITKFLFIRHQFLNQQLKIFINNLTNINLKNVKFVEKIDFSQKTQIS